MTASISPDEARAVSEMVTMYFRAGAVKDPAKGFALFLLATHIAADSFVGFGFTAAEVCQGLETVTDGIAKQIKPSRLAG